MAHSSDDDLNELLRCSAPELPVRAELRDTILASTPGYVRGLERLVRTQRIAVPAGLRARILAAAPEQGWRGIVAALWPFGPVWRPAAGLAAMACLGIFIGLSDAVSLPTDVTVNGALSEDVQSLVLGVAGDAEQEDFAWQD
jgi:hypothetical protein